MMKPFSLLLLASSIFFANCHCNNADTGNGPRDPEENVGPKFSLVLADGIKPEDLCANRSVPLVLKDENFSKHDTTKYKICYSKDDNMGDFHFMDADGKAGERIDDYDDSYSSKKQKSSSSGSEIEIKNGGFPVLFVPVGKPGKHSLSLEVYYKESWNKVSIELDLKSIISLEVSEEIKTSKITTAYLNINADLKEEFTLKSVRMDYYPVEMTYDNGGREGVWAEVNSVRIGDKFKGGEHELSLKLYGDNDKVGDGVYQGDKSNVRLMQPVEKWVEIIQHKVPEYWVRPVDLEMVLIDSKGNEYTTKATFKVEDISFDIELGEVKWIAFPHENEFKKGMFKFKCEVKMGGEGKKEHRHKFFKVLSFRADDGSAVSLVDIFGKVWTVCKDSELTHDLYFRFDEMIINSLGNPTKLTLKLEGSGGVVKSADLEIDAPHKELILFRNIERIHQRAIDLTREFSFHVGYNGKLNFRYDDAEKWGKEAVAFLEEVKFLGSQINSKIFFKSISLSTAKEIEDTLKQIQSLKGWFKYLNEAFGFNFQSPI